ncbi:hypothetical protein [Caudoviricetes sp.]|nr:hypothetical protein [Caudoviricetes sp.]UOF81340.1 hypothetical protein [Caudoviricetes sp.]
MTVHYQTSAGIRRYTDVEQLFLTRSGAHTLRFYQRSYTTITDWEQYMVTPDRRSRREEHHELRTR